jgi:hypothetical protein
MGRDRWFARANKAWTCWFRWFAPSLVLVLGLVAACGGDAKTSAPSYVGEEKSWRLSRGEAGTLSLGAAELSLPEGALQDDSEISVTVKAKTGMPDAKDIAIDVYDYGPDGSQFDKPVKLAFDTQGVKTPKGKKLTVAFLEDGEWKSLSTTLKNGKASAETSHFTPFTLLFVLDDSGGQQVDGQCATDFEPCGGNLVGTWEYTLGCVTAPPGALEEDDDANVFAQCEDKPVSAISVDLSGQAVFGKDGSFNSEQKVTIQGGYRISKACLAEVGESMGTSSLTCAQIDGTPDGDGCLLGPNASTPETSEDAVVGTYSASGTSVTVVDSESDPEDPPTPSPYCVRGDTLIVRVATGEGGPTIVYHARRK